MSRRAAFEDMLATGRDDALLRFALGQACLEEDDERMAIVHLKAAISHDRQYSAAWKLLGRAQQQAGMAEHAAQTYREGIAIANDNGDRQAAREMTVFLRRLDKQAGPA